MVTKPYPGLALNQTDLFAGYVLGQNDTVGTYIVQVWYGDRMLLEKIFKVVSQ